MNAVYQRDLLYPTENIAEPGSVHVEVFNPDSNARMPVVIESKTAHSPIKFIDSIVRVMQTEIFDRILVDIRKNVSLYFKVNEEMKKEFGDKKYVMLTYNGDKIEYTAMDEFLQ